MLQLGQVVYFHGLQAVRLDAITEGRIHSTGVEDGVLYFYEASKFSQTPRDSSDFHFIHPDEVVEIKPTAEVLPEVIEAPPAPTNPVENKHGLRVRAKHSEVA